MKKASIDLGTNTCLLLVKDEETVLHDESTIVRLGQGVDQSKELHPEAMVRAKTCLQKYSEIAKKLGVNPSDIFAVGTASSRDAKNSASFYDSIEKEFGIRFRILSGDEEAKATFLGAALPGIQVSKMVVMDIGGGSTELVSLPKNTDSIFGESLNIGAVRMTERFLKSDPSTDEEFWKCESAIDEALQSMKPWRDALNAKLSGSPILVAVAGTAVTLGMLQLGLLDFDRAQIDGMKITRGDAHRLVEELKWRTVSERQAMPGMEPKRADVILAGALIFWRAMETLDFKEAIISTRGLRYGVFAL